MTYLTYSSYNSDWSIGPLLQLSTRLNFVLSGDFNPLLVGALPQVLFQNPPWPPDFEGGPKPVVDEGLKFGDDPFSQSPCLGAM